MLVQKWRHNELHIYIYIQVIIFCFQEIFSCIVHILQTHLALIYHEHYFPPPLSCFQFYAHLLVQSYANWNFIGLVQYVTICLKMSPKKLLYVFVLSRLNYYNLLLVGCPKYHISKLQKLQNNAATHFQNNQTCPHHSYASFSSLDTYWAEDQVVSALL